MPNDQLSEALWPYYDRIFNLTEDGWGLMKKWLVGDLWKICLSASRDGGVHGS